MAEWKWERPVYTLAAWDHPGDRCRGRLGPCIKLAELAMPLPDRQFTLLYCLDCWEWMADHLIGQGYTVDVTEAASAVLATRKQRPIRLHVTDVRAPSHVRTGSRRSNRYGPHRCAHLAASAQEGGDCADA
jgi:hypothetical protein